MTDPLAIIEVPFPVPERASRVHLAEEISRLMALRAKLEARAEAERRSALKDKSELLLGLLEIADALDRILQRGAGAEESRQALARIQSNVESTRRLLAQKLAKQRVTRLALTGQVLDPNLADAEEYRDRSDLADETVLSEVISGYWWDNQVLRRAQVIVSRRP